VLLIASTVKLLLLLFPLLLWEKEGRGAVGKEEEEGRFHVSYHR
jgi:hypothetical protein